MADCVESLICALNLSSDLRTTLQWISDIKLVPLEKAHIIDKFKPNYDYTFDLREPLEHFQFEIGMTVSELFEEYFKVI